MSFSKAFLLTEEDPSNRLAFQCWPEEISINKGAEYTNVDIVGRSEPVRVYSVSTAVVYNFTMVFVASVSPAEDAHSSKGLHVAKALNWLHSMTYPRYESGIAEPPHVLWFIVSGYIHARVVMKTAGVTHPSTNPWLRSSKFGYLPMYGACSVQLEEVNLFPPGYEDIRGIGFGMMKGLDSQSLGT